MWVSLPLGERLLEVGKAFNPRPCYIIRRALAPKYLENLINLTIALEQWLPVSHLDHDAAGGPDVHTEVIPLLAHEYLRRALPQRDHLMRQSLQRQFETARKPEVADLDVLGLVVDKDVLRF